MSALCGGLTHDSRYSRNAVMSNAVDGHAAEDSNVAESSTKAAQNEVDAVKQPPPETSESIWTRTRVIISYWAVILCLGLPMWWKTTSIYRAQLPFQSMVEWDQGTACLPTYPLEIQVAAPSIPCSDAKHFIQTTQHALDDLNEFSPYHLRLRLTDAKVSKADESDKTCQFEVEELDTTEPTLAIKLVPREGKPPSLELQTFSADGVLHYASNQLPAPTSSTSALSTYLANELYRQFKEEQASIAYKFASLSPVNVQGGGPTTRSAGNPAGFIRSLPKDLFESIANRNTKAFKYADTYHLTFSLFSAGPLPSSWDIAQALQAHIIPWVDALSSISHFSINSQIQLYSQLSPSLHLIKDGITNGSHIAQADLSGFVNAAEWPLSPSIGATGPTINFVLYIPSTNQSPLTIAGTNGATEWLIPQWGGIAIYNPIVKDDGTLSIPENLDASAMAAAFATFRSQFLTLIGLPGDQNTPLPLRIQSLVRLQTTSLFISASSTMGSLARLTQSLPSIPIPLSVSRNVESTISHLTNTCKALESGHFNEALQEAREAEKEAEQAFFEKSMVGQVYFPDEHKIAVYAPLLGPISVPLVLCLVREAKRFLQERKQKVAK